MSLNWFNYLCKSVCVCVYQLMLSSFHCFIYQDKCNSLSGKIFPKEWRVKYTSGNNNVADEPLFKIFKTEIVRNPVIFLVLGIIYYYVRRNNFMPSVCVWFFIDILRSEINKILLRNFCVKLQIHMPLFVIFLLYISKLLFVFVFH